MFCFFSLVDFMLWRNTTWDMRPLMPVQFSNYMPKKVEKDFRHRCHTPSSVFQSCEDLHSCAFHSSLAAPSPSTQTHAHIHTNSTTQHNTTQQHKGAILSNIFHWAFLRIRKRSRIDQDFKKVMKSCNSFSGTIAPLIPYKRYWL